MEIEFVIYHMLRRLHFVSVFWLGENVGKTIPTMSRVQVLFG